MDSCREMTVQETATLLKSSDRILFLCHQKPDGDTFGSGFALLYAMRALGKTARIECSDGFPSRYAFLYPDFDPEGQPTFEPKLVVAADIADTQLLGPGTARYADRVDLCIDHHPSNSRYSKLLLLDPRAAGTVELVYRVLEELGVELTLQIAACLYTGLATDTGCFRYSNTTPESHILAARLMEMGLDSFSINKLMFETKSVARMELERLVMKTLEYHYEKRLALIVISSESILRTGLPEEEMEGIASIPRQIEGVEASVTLQQKGPELWRISMRSNERINASSVCARLGGGGHARAAGCTLQGPLAEVKAQMIAELKQEF